MSLSKKLKKLLFEKDITPTDLSKGSGVPLPTIHRMVTGQTKHPNDKSLQALSRYFDMPIKELFDIKEDNIDIPENSDLVKIPLIKWDEINKDTTESTKCVIANDVSASSFAVLIASDFLFPVVDPHSILIFDPEAQITNRSYCLVQVHNFSNIIFRQVLLDVDNTFIKSINTDLNEKSIRLLNKEDKILAKLMEIRKKT